MRRLTFDCVSCLAARDTEIFVPNDPANGE